MIIMVLTWYLAILLSGWLVFPLVYRLLPFLPDRGITLAKPAALLLWGYAWWLLTSLHILQNDGGGVLVGLCAVAALSAWAFWREDRVALVRWLQENRTTVLLSEGIFLLAFVAWAWVRGTYPDISGTEKPMELAFINAILYSPSFPPHDPWLSGYAISYYYFGYAMVAMLARFTGIGGEVAFNLALVSWFAMSAAAASGLLFNLLARGSAGKQRVGQSAYAAGLLAPLFLLLVSNLEGFLEMLHARGIFWQRTETGFTSAFWSWLKIQELVNPPAEPLSWVPERVGGIWWWRASRVLQDFDLAGNPREIIDEFPFFSYLLGDLHPHVLSMPFVLLAVGLALHLYWREGAREETSVEPVDRLLRLVRLPETWLAVLALGGLAFLNTWDFPIYLGLYGAAYGLAAYKREGWRWALGSRVLLLMIPVGAAGILAYLPFYLGFQNQAGGFLPSLVFFTRGVHLWVMFAALLTPVVIWAVLSAFRERFDWKSGLFFALVVVFGLWILSALMGLLVEHSPTLAGIYGGSESLVGESIRRRLLQPGGWLSLLVVLGLIWGLLAGLRSKTAQVQPDLSINEVFDGGRDSNGFVLLLVLLGAGLVLFPEFFYLRDQFGWRMNTIFKFYYQAWIVWSLAAAYASVILWRVLQGGLRWAWRAAWVALVAAALVYPFFGISERLSNFNLASWTLDGSAFMARYAALDLQAIQWLRQAPYGVVAEAVGGSYSGYARVATFSGKPGVLGWPGHESQWRGGAQEIGTREPDIELLFRARRWEQAQEILARYNIRYVYVGSLELGKYATSKALFDRNLAVVYSNEQVTIYEAPVNQGE